MSIKSFDHEYKKATSSWRRRAQCNEWICLAGKCKYQYKYNKLAKARKTRKSLGTLSLKKFGPGKLWVEKVWAQNISIDFLAEADNFKKINFLFSSSILHIYVKSYFSFQPGFSFLDDGIREWFSPVYILVPLTF